MQKDKHYISFIKGVSWRIIGTMDTMLLSFLFTGSIGNALQIGITEVFTKIIFFYFHERLWFKIKWGLQLKEEYKQLTEEEINQSEDINELYIESHIRSVVKGISWRIVGTLDTIVIATFWTGDYTKALKIGCTEVITKITLYYFHERIWMHFMRKNDAEKI